MQRTNHLSTIADVVGGESAPNLSGKVRFYQRNDGVLVVAEIHGLPDSETGFFAFHIHEGRDCGGAGFPNTGSHYDPFGREHPDHAGDLPPLLSADGTANLAVLTNRFALRDVIGRTVVIHGDPDDFKTQPSGNAGTKIACGVIRRA